MERDDEKEPIERASIEKTSLNGKKKKKMILENQRARGHFKNYEFENITIQASGRWQRISGKKKTKQDNDYLK